jgi:hypothetical protein
VSTDDFYGSIIGRVVADAFVHHPNGGVPAIQVNMAKQQVNVAL